jgi:hypothetical protein
LFNLINFKALLSHSEFHFEKSICQFYYMQQYCITSIIDFIS